MEIAINTSFSIALRQAVGEGALLETLAGAGFSAAELSLDELSRQDSPWAGPDWQSHADALAQKVKSLGIRFHQARAPQDFQWLRRDTPALEVLVYPAMDRAFAICARMGIPRLVVEPVTHPIVVNIATWMEKVNRDYFARLHTMAKAYGVELAVTNLVRCFETAQQLMALGEEISVCLDPGRCKLSAQDAPSMIRQLGGRLCGLYLSGNHGLRDQRCIPGQEEVNWQAVLQALAEVDYRGDLTLLLSQEETGCLDGAHGFGLDFIPNVLELAHSSGSYLAAKLEGLRAGKGGVRV